MYRALAPLPHSLQLLLPLFHPPILAARWQTSLNYNEGLPTHMCWLICFVQTQHSTSTVTAACFSDYKCERTATSWAHTAKISVSVVEEEWALYWYSCSLTCDTSLLPGLPQQKVNKPKSQWKLQLLLHSACYPSTRGAASGVCCRV